MLQQDDLQLMKMVNLLTSGRDKHFGGQESGSACGAKPMRHQVAITIFIGKPQRLQWSPERFEHLKGTVLDVTWRVIEILSSLASCFIS